MCCKKKTKVITQGAKIVQSQELLMKKQQSAIGMTSSRRSARSFLLRKSSQMFSSRRVQAHCCLGGLFHTQQTNCTGVCGARELSRGWQKKVASGGHRFIRDQRREEAYIAERRGLEAVGEESRYLQDQRRNSERAKRLSAGYETLSDRQLGVETSSRRQKGRTKLAGVGKRSGEPQKKADERGKKTSGIVATRKDGVPFVIQDDAKLVPGRFSKVSFADTPWRLVPAWYVQR